MYLNKQRKPNGDTYLSIREKYHVPGVGAREKTIESIGYVSKLKEDHDDPIAFYTQYARELTEKKKKARTRTIQIDQTSILAPGTKDARNVGYGIFKHLYKALGLDRFWNWKTRGRNMQFNTDQIFRLLVFARALQPGSKRHTLQHKDFFFEPFDGFTLDDAYHAMDVIAEEQEELQAWVFKHSQDLVPRDMSISYFDCTNYYFDISHPDLDTLNEEGQPVGKDGKGTAAKYRKRGPEKNHRPDPILGMGLLMDRNGIPVAYDIFPGNESEKVHMRPLVNRVKSNIQDCRVIFVADRGLNTSDNIYWLNGDNRGEKNGRDGYVYGQSVRGADAEFKEWVLSGGYQEETLQNEDGTQATFTHKSRIHPKDLHVNVTKPGQAKPAKKKVTVDQKQMAYYSEKYARKQKTERAIMVSRAKDLVQHPKKYDKATSAGSAAYVANLSFNKQTGEIVEGRELLLDEEKIAEEEKYDGYYSIVTSELHMGDREMREVYRGLARIEDSFKVTKSCLQARPVYVWKNEHIEAHFAVCFLALVLVRLLEAKLERKYPAKRILESLKQYNCTKIDTATWQFTYYDEIIEACGRVFDLELNKKYRNQQEIQRLLRY